MKLFLFIFTYLITSALAIKFHHFNPTTHNTPNIAIERHKRESIDVTLIQDDHLYYKSTFDPDGSDTMWIELADIATPYNELSQGYYLYAPVDLQFRFPFYGHFIQNVALTTHGFLSTADIYHSRIHLTQYIAPFSADFNPRLSSDSKIYFSSAPGLFIAQWSELFLASDREAGNFTFQVQLRPNGEITFVYKKIPLNLAETTTQTYNSFAGLSDGYTVNVSSRIFLYSYHDVSLPGAGLEGGVYVLTPLPNCVAATNQSACNITSCQTDFNCGWCESIQVCSDGLDRKRQNWVESGCQQDSIISCPSLPPPSTQTRDPGYAAILAIGLLFLVLAPVVIVIVVVAVWCVWYKTRYGRIILKMPKVTTDKSSNEHIVLTEPEDATL